MVIFKVLHVVQLETEVKSAFSLYRRNSESFSINIIYYHIIINNYYTIYSKGVISDGQSITIDTIPYEQFTTVPALQHNPLPLLLSSSYSASTYLAPRFPYRESLQLVVALEASESC